MNVGPTLKSHFEATSPILQLKLHASVNLGEIES